VGRYDEALAALQRAIALNPAAAVYRVNLGAVYDTMNRPTEAVACYEEADRLQPGDAKCHSNWANALLKLGRAEEAEAHCRHAVRLQPDSPEAYNNLGNVLQDLGRLDEAVTCYRQALHLRPGSAEAYTNLGNALKNLGRLDEAAESMQTALRLKPHWPEGQVNWGAALAEQGKRDEALALYDQALRLAPHCAIAHHNRALLWLLRGDFAHGWPEYEWRWQARNLTRPSFPQPCWDGSALQGRTILLYAEQGLGDTIQFARYAPLVKERGGRVVLQCQPSLLTLLSTCPGIDFLVAHEVYAFDVQAPLLSLPGIFNTTLETIPARVPYLAADPEQVRRWRTELERCPGFRIGITWQGDRRHRNDLRRSVALAQFAPLAELEGVRLVSLQVGPGTEQLAEAGPRLGVIDLASRFDCSSFTDAAAVVKGLDLVVTVDTALAHLAGALGVPVWVALPFAPDWRWLLGREDSPWYPTMRLFRHRRPGDWDDVFARIAEAVRALRSSASAAGRPPWR
jgi:Flp pilus assembly protein TadD